MLTGIVFGFITAVTLGINHLFTAVVARPPRRRVPFRWDLYT